MYLIQKTDFEKINLELITVEVSQILEKYPFHPTCHQIGLTHSKAAKDSTEKVYESVGSLWDSVKNDFRRNPEEFVFFNEEFKSTVFFQIYEDIQSHFQINVGRMRLMLRPPVTCYSMHFDESERYHLAITTNDDCYFYFKGHDILQIPSDGHLYKFNACLPHTAMNCGSTARVHLVVDCLR